jgi:hypothetical protein
MNLPYELLWGVDIAVKKLRPGAQFQLEGTRITLWNDPNNLLPPTWEEINQQMLLDKKQADEWMQKNNIKNHNIEERRSPPLDGKIYKWDDSSEKWIDVPDYDLD